MLTLAVQAGGASRRMGQDKALLSFLGRSLIQHVIARLIPIADETIITTNQPTAYAFLGLPLYTDIRPNRGALGGLYTALHYAKHPFVAVVACDMPFASAALLAAQRDLLIAENADVVIPAGADGYEPFHAVYRRASCLPAIEAAMDRDQWKMIAWFDAVKVRALTADEIRRHDPHGLAFQNLNTPEEFAEAEATFKRFNV
jgi:molybdopterin-guanine dinucleotide biosynthesis protein A